MLQNILFEAEETEMKRILSVVLMIAMLMVGFCSCEMADLGTKEPELPETEPHVHAFAPATCAAPKTCTGCGYTEGEKLDRHNPNGDVCTDCGLDFFEELAKLIKENDNYKDSNDYGDERYAYASGDCQVLLSGDEKTVVFRNILYNNGIIETCDVSITRGAMTTKRYEWSYWKVLVPFESESVEGVFNPMDFSASIDLEYKSYDNCTPSVKAYRSAEGIDEVIITAFVPLLKMSDKNLRPSDYGFVNYD